MIQKIKWFVLGVISTLIVLGTWGWFLNRPANAVRGFPQEAQNFMLQLNPWLKTAREAKIGPFLISVPSKSTDPPGAIIWPNNGGFPQILLSENEISLVDKKLKIISLNHYALKVHRFLGD